MAARTNTAALSHDGGAGADADAEQSRPGLLARMYAGMDIDLHTLLRMLKLVASGQTLPFFLY